jgi:hypothetical protein
MCWIQPIKLNCFKLNCFDYEKDIVDDYAVIDRVGLVSAGRGHGADDEASGCVG